MSARRFYYGVLIIVGALVVALGLALAAFKLWLLPAIHHWQKPIAQALSQAVGVPVSIGHIRARWQGLYPEIELEDLVLSDADQPLLSIPYAFGQLKLSSFWTLEPHFAHLDIQGLSLSVVRDEQGKIDVLGQSLGLADDSSDAAELRAAFYHWLGAQGEFKISNSRLIWHDIWGRKQPLELELEHLNMRQHKGQLRARGLLSSLRHAHTRLHLDGSWQLPAAQAQHSEGADSAGSFSPLQSPSAGSGQLHIKVEHLQPSAWRRWVNIPSFLYQGTIQAQFQLSIAQEVINRITGTFTIDQPFWGFADEWSSVAPQPFFQARHASFEFDLPRPAIERLATLTATDAMPVYLPDAHWQGQVDDLYLQIPSEFDEPLFLKQLAFSLRSQQEKDVSPTGRGASGGSQALGADEPLINIADESTNTFAATDRHQGLLPPWVIEHLHIDGGAGQLQAQGQLQWHLDDPWLSYVQLTGTGNDISLDSLYRYFPKSLDDDLREWLQLGLRAGHLDNMQFAWQGVFDDFEHYQEKNTKGSPGHSAEQFLLEADLIDATIDYYPPEEDEKGWPAIVGLDGSLHWHNNQLRIQADNQPFLQMSAERLVQIERISAVISDLYERADLHIDAHSQGQAEDYFLLWPHSNLGSLLDDSLTVQQLNGQWEVALALDVPLGLELEQMEEQVQVHGTVWLEQSSASPSFVQLWPELPPFEQLHGSFSFTTAGVHEVDLAGQWLGGPVALKGGLTASDSEVLDIAAQVQSQALQQYFAHPALQAVEGTLPVQFKVHIDAQEVVEISAQSDLVGLTVDLPAPLNKINAQTSWPLSLNWQILDEQGDQNQLRFELADRLYGAAAFDFAAARVEQLLLSTTAPKEQAAQETEPLWVDLQYPFLDLDAWWDWLEVFDRAEGQSWQWPKLSKVRIKADEAYALGLELQHLTYTHQLTAPKQWRADISSEQVAGTLFWHSQPSGGHQLGYIDAHFQRFALLAEQAEALGLRPPKGSRIITQGDLSGTVKNDAPIDERNDTVKGELSTELPAVDHAPPWGELPAIRLKVDNFTVRGYPLGALTLEAAQLGQGRGWLIEQFNLELPQAMKTHGKGHWQIWGADPVLALQWQTDFKDLGVYAQHMGLSGLIEGGRGQLHAQFDWQALPWRGELQELSGQAQLQLHDGRLEPVRSRSAKLLEFLSLQSLSRLARLDLDIGSLLKDGFPFHLLEGSITVRDNWAHTDDYKVISPVGALYFDGRTNIQTEAIDAQAIVIPDLDVSGAALAAGMVVNPIVGFGALIAQWILKHPLAKAMTVRYQILGDWDHFEVQEIATLSEAPPAPPTPDFGTLQNTDTSTGNNTDTDTDNGTDTGNGTDTDIYNGTDTEPAAKLLTEPRLLSKPVDGAYSPTGAKPLADDEASVPKQNDAERPPAGALRLKSKTPVDAPDTKDEPISSPDTTEAKTKALSGDDDG